MATSNTYIGPQDGWIKVITSGANNLRITGNPGRHAFFVWGAADGSPPTAANIGVQCSCEGFQIDSDTTDSFWVKVPTNLPGSVNNDGKLRVDVYAAPVVAP